MVSVIATGSKRRQLNVALHAHISLHPFRNAITLDGFANELVNPVWYPDHLPTNLGYQLICGFRFDEYGVPRRTNNYRPALLYFRRTVWAGCGLRVIVLTRGVGDE